MKRILITFSLLMVASLVMAQEIHTGESFELNAPIPSTESHEYQATAYVKLQPGFQSPPEAGNYVKMQVLEEQELREWYYEILNDDGTVTYQHLLYASDTTINHKDVKIIIRTNTLYDKANHQEVTREYVYESDGKVYWWNKTTRQFSMLYDYGAEEGSEWEITVGLDSITMHVDAVDEYEYEGKIVKMLHVSDDNEVFSGIIFCGVGHMTSYFPERLMQKKQDYRVVGIRCFWRNGELVFKYGERDCDEVYQEYHNGIEENGHSTGSGTAGTLTVYPNPTNGILTIHHSSFRIHHSAFRITNLMGQTVLTGSLNAAETQQIDVSNLPQGMYFISVDDMTQKFVVR